MIIVRRSSSNVNRLQKNLILSMNTTSTMSVPLVPQASSNSSTTGTGPHGGGSGENQSFDWANIFSPENKSKTVELLTLDRENCGFFNLSRLKDEYNPEKKAAVLIPLCLDKDGKPSLLYNLRSLTLSSHKGEISFPGGNLDPEDKGDPVSAAIRETNEELGISPAAIEVWTSLRIFPTVSSNKGVVPILGFVKGLLDPTKLKICQDEVDHAFTISLEHLCDPTNWENDSRKKFKDFALPMWKNLNVYNGTEQVHLWGLTAFVTHIALLALLPKDVYQRKVPFLKLKLKNPTNNSKL